MLLEDEVEEDLDEDEEEDDGEISVSEEPALRRRLTRHSTPQGVDAPGCSVKRGEYSCCSL